MARREKVHAIVLSRRDMGEADRLLTLFTREQGILRVVAKGVRKIPSRRGGHSEPLTQVVALISGADAYRWLVFVEPFNEYRALHQNPTAVQQVELLGKLVVALLQPEQAYPELFDALAYACEHVALLPSSKRYLLEVAIGFYVLRCAGLAPQLHQCQTCQIRTPQSAVIMDSQLGGWRCLTCHGSWSNAAHSLSPRLLKAMQWVNKYPDRALALQVTETEGSQLAASARHYFTRVVEQPIAFNHAS